MKKLLDLIRIKSDEDKENIKVEYDSGKNV